MNSPTMKQERELNEMFRYAARRERKTRVMDYGPDSTLGTQRLRQAVWLSIMAIGVILFCLCMIGIVDAISTKGGW